MTVQEFEALLFSRMPSDRASAAQWALTNELTPVQVRLIGRAIAAEPVSRVKVLLNQALAPVSPRAIRSGRVPRPIYDSPTNILEELSGMIRHELTPPAGWIRSAANREIEAFDSSRTRRMVDALVRRINGLSDLAAAYRNPRRRQMSLNELVDACLDNEMVPKSLVRVTYAHASQDLVLSDPNLLELLLSNVISNAVEACPESSRKGQVLIAVGGDNVRFWMRVTNPIDGQDFEYRSVAASGRTTKDGHRGLGTRVIELVAGALGCDFSLSAEHGEATFVLRGERYV